MLSAVCYVKPKNITPIAAILIAIIVCISNAVKNKQLLA